ncbi:DUF6443 domain-containing protein, partial [Marinifilum caeruleilacunae]
VYYWQTSASGIDKTNSNVTKDFTVDGATYYIRSYNATLDTWSTAQSGIVEVYNNPGIPAAPTATYADGVTTLRMPQAPDHETYYWQNSVAGESTVDVSTNRDFTVDGSIYFLRSKHNVTGYWSVARQGNITVESEPITPSTPTVSNQTGKVVLTMPVAPSGESYYWQETAESTSLTDSLPTKEVYVSKTVYLRSRKDAPTYLWSNATSIEVNVDESPVVYTNKNYILTTIIEEEGITDEASVDGLSVFQKSENIQYFDGLGRPIQTVSIKMSPDLQDLIQPIVYDNFGREKKSYLPFATVGRTTNGVLHNDPINRNNWINHYDHVELDFTYAEKEFDGSLLHRVVEQGAPGSAWKIDKTDNVSNGTGRTVKKDYLSNLTNEVVCFELDENGNLIHHPNHQYYTEKELYKTISKNENWEDTGNTNLNKLHTIEEFKDKQGQLILKRSYVEDSNNPGGNPKEVNTYYVYDDFGLLRYVLPPQAFADGNVTISSEELSGYCYWYKYDGRKRMTHKKIPGAEEVWMVYDSRDRLVAKQDGNQRNRKDENGQPSPCWQFIKYDVLNRPVMTGIYINGDSQSGLQGEVNNNNNYPVATMFEERDNSTGNLYAYTNRSFPKTISELDVLTVSYYDDYNIDGLPLTSDKRKYHNVTGYNVIAELLPEPMGQLTATLTKVFNPGVNWRDELWAINFYDKKYRIVQTWKENYLMGIDLITKQYDFAGRLVKKLHDHNVNGYTTYEEKWYDYDHAGRMISIELEYRGDAVEKTRAEIVHMDYNELGQLEKKVLYGNLQQMDYQYNIRGWLTQMNSHNPSQMAGRDNDNFGFELNYDTGSTLFGGQNQFNGNIGAMQWWTNAEDGIDHEQAYGYRYDALNRILKADYRENTGTWHNPIDKFDVFDITYDLNGNIMTLSRDGEAGHIDQLTYGYKNMNNPRSNRLMYVNDAHTQLIGFKESSSNQDEYDYDWNGNMKRDDNKNLTSIDYNILNLPESIVKNVSNNENRTIQYAYDATGVKLENRIESGQDLQYLGNFVYIDGSLAYIINEEGKLNVGDNGEYQFFVKDHLGNTRISLTEDKQIKETNHYYPFGMRMDMVSSLSDANQKYLYNAKELQDETDWLDYGARMYEPSLGRFIGIDILSDQFAFVTNYNYAENSPIANIDLWGLQAFPVHGTNSDSETFYALSDDFLKGLSGNSEVIRGFNWPKGTNEFDNNETDRGVAAQALAAFVLANLDDNGEPITIIGHSHGGNVGIQAINIIKKALNKSNDDRLINLITIATPAYNGVNDIENPSNVEVDNHLHFFSNYDEVQTLLATIAGGKVASRTYNNQNTINVEVKDYIDIPTKPNHFGRVRNTRAPYYDPISSHFLHTRPNLLKTPGSLPEINIDFRIKKITHKQIEQ